MPEAGVPNAGVTSVGELAKTNAPVPVSSVTAEARFAEDGVARNVATPAPNPDTPVEIGKPVAFVNVALEGVPSAGVTSVGELANTKEPVPVSSVTAEARFAEDGVSRNVATPAPRAVSPVPPRFAGRVPVVPASIGRPVAFVSVALDGVPSAGVVKLGLLDKTTEPVPVDVVTPVPPLATGRVPVTCVVKLTLDSVPPNVKFPVEVTVPVSVMPLTVPVPPTEVTPSGVLEEIFTKSELFHAAKHFSPATIVTPVVGPAPRSTTEPVPALITM